MNKKLLLLLVVAALLALPGLQDQANPIMEGYFNEFMFDSGSWRLEMHVHSTMTLDGWSLTSRAGQAYFKSGIQLGNLYAVIAPESLITPLTINELGDSITLHSPQIPLAHLWFGPGGWIPAPRNGQSICFKESGTQFYYLDNTPTLGRENDGLNAMGIVRGRVADSLGQPIVSSMISWDSFPVQHAYSDTAGYYSITEFARPVTFMFSHPNFSSRDISVQVWPESTIVVDVNLRTLSGVGGDGQDGPASFKLWLNYPNPFNPNTTINYRIPSQSQVVLSVFDIGGKEVASLANEVKRQGSYSLKWDASALPSGVYFCRIQSGMQAQTIKMVLLR